MVLCVVFPPTFLALIFFSSEASVLSSYITYFREYFVLTLKFKTKKNGVLSWLASLHHGDAITLVASTVWKEIRRTAIYIYFAFTLATCQDYGVVNMLAEQLTCPDTYHCCSKNVYTIIDSFWCLDTQAAWEGECLCRNQKVSLQ